MSLTAVSAAGVGVALTADLRDAGGEVRQVALGEADAATRTRCWHGVPAGPWELEALEV